MARVLWDQTGERRFETGVDQGVLYPAVNGAYPLGVAWNGLTGITESPSGAEPTPLYADNIKYVNLLSAEDYGATIEALTYPDAWALLDGSAAPSTGVTVGQQPRKAFGLSYRTRVGNDVLGADFGYKLHLVYGALAGPSEKGYTTINDTPEGVPFSWDITTTPVAVTGYKPTAILVIDSTKVTAAALTNLENALYGTAGVDPRLPLPDEVLAFFTGTVTNVVPVAPTATAAGVITIPTTTGIDYRRGDTNAIVTGTYTIPTINQTMVIVATAKPGYQLTPGVDDDFGFTRTV